MRRLGSSVSHSDLQYLQAALTNTLSPGDKVVCFRYGQFSHLWIDMMQRLGLDVHVIDRPWGEGAHEGMLEDLLRKVHLALYL